MTGNLRVQVSEEGADAERVAALASYLRAELLQLDVRDVAHASRGAPPLGARGSEVSVAGGLLVALGQAADSLRSVVLVIRDWLRRGEPVGRVVRLELGGDMLELSQATAAEQERLIELFILRHSEKGLSEAGAADRLVDLFEGIPPPGQGSRSKEARYPGDGGRIGNPVSGPEGSRPAASSPMSPGLPLRHGPLPEKAPPGDADPAEASIRNSWRSPFQAFTDGLGGIFDIFGGIGRQRARVPAFEDTLAPDARELSRELGLTIRSAHGSREDAAQ